MGIRGQGSLHCALMSSLCPLGDETKAGRGNEGSPRCLQISISQLCQVLQHGVHQGDENKSDGHGEVNLFLRLSTYPRLPRLHLLTCLPLYTTHLCLSPQCLLPPFFPYLPLPIYPLNLPPYTYLLPKYTPFFTFSSLTSIFPQSTPYSTHLPPI